MMRPVKCRGCGRTQYVPGGGGHNTGAALRDGMARANSAMMLGWWILRVMPEQLLEYETVEMVQSAMRVCRR